MFDKDGEKITLIVGIVLFVVTGIASFFYSPWDTGEKVPLVKQLLIWGMLDAYKMDELCIFPFLILMTIQNIIFRIVSQESTISNPVLRYFVGYLYENSFTYFSSVIVWKLHLKIIDYFYDYFNENIDTELGMLLAFCLIILVTILLLPELIHAFLYACSVGLYTALLGEYFTNVQTVETGLILTIVFVVVSSLIIEWIMSKVYDFTFFKYVIRFFSYF